jgi:hypothetical protein
MTTLFLLRGKGCSKMKHRYFPKLTVAQHACDLVIYQAAALFHILYESVMWVADGHTFVSRTTGNNSLFFKRLI